MGWCESPPFFCAASETVHNVIMALLDKVALLVHDMETHMLQDANIQLQGAAHLLNIVEVFVDDFIAATNNCNKEHLTHFSRAMLFGVHLVFPLPEITGHKGEDPVSQTKLKNIEGTWTHHKEILGWLVDGASFTIQLPPEKCAKIETLFRKVKKK